MESVDFEQLRRYRSHELALVLPLLPEGATILEIGAGAGWQAKALAAQGFAVQAIDVDLAGAGYRERREWPVTLYDGRRIPFPDACFDVVFSSNVLEHVLQVEQFQAEIQRVLRPAGRAVHVVPTGSWRFWTNATYYPVLGRRYLRKGLAIASHGETPEDKLAVLSDAKERSSAAAGPATAAFHKLRRIAFPARHGERGSFLSEVYWFSRRSWDELFTRTGWRIEACFPTRLFYSGYFLLGPALSMPARRALSYAFGSACLIYALRHER